MAELKRWKAASNYAGEEYPDYYVVGGRSRDSTLLEEANFEATLKRLGGESKTVIVPRSGHWAAGWIETILVHKDDVEAVKKAQAILDDLEGYPVLDDELYSNKEYEAAISNIKDAGYKYNLTEDDARKIYRWLGDQGNDMENTDDTGFYPDDAELEAAVKAIRKSGTHKASKKVKSKSKKHGGQLTLGGMRHG